LITKRYVEISLKLVQSCKNVMISKHDINETSVNNFDVLNFGILAFKLFLMKEMTYNQINPNPPFILFAVDFYNKIMQN